MTQILRPVVAIALYALLLPVAGPALDHHYVEWQHNHAHAYWGPGAEGEASFHLHVYEYSGGHSHDNESGPTGGPQPPEGVAYFSSYDGAGAGPINSPSGPAGEPLFRKDSGGCPVLAVFDQAFIPPSGALIAPPTRPPATILL